MPFKPININVQKLLQKLTKIEFTCFITVFNYLDISSLIKDIFDKLCQIHKKVKILII